MSTKLVTFGVGIFSLFLLAFVMFPATDASAFKIHCADNIDLEEYPLCQYVEQWNQSEKFNELVVDELKNRTNDINSDPNSFQKIYSDLLNKINQENPGLYEEGVQIKSWISEQIAKKSQ